MIHEDFKNNLQKFVSSNTYRDSVLSRISHSKIQTEDCWLFEYISCYIHYQALFRQVGVRKFALWLAWIVQQLTWKTIQLTRKWPRSAWIMVHLAGLQLVLNGGNGNTMQSNGLEVRLNRQLLVPDHLTAHFWSPVGLYFIPSPQSAVCILHWPLKKFVYSCHSSLLMIQHDTLG